MDSKVINDINEQIKDNKILLFMKGSPYQPQCGFSMKVAQILLSYDVEFSYIDVLEFPEVRQKHIIDLAELLLEVPCLPSIMKSKITSVPIKYTRERPVHKNFIQFGEAGIYWGEEHIKIHIHFIHV